MNTLILGSQEWSTENLSKRVFNDGTEIPLVQTLEEWHIAYLNKEPACCVYENDKDNLHKYGLLYNWFAVVDNRGLAPVGWRIPSDSDWLTLSDYIKQSSSKDVTLKKTDEWGEIKNFTKELGLNILPAGYRNFYGYFFFIHKHAYFWSSSEHYENLAWYRTTDFLINDLIRYYNIKGNGFSVRCVRG